MTTAIVHLIPENIGADEAAPFMVLGGFLALYVLGALAGETSEAPAGGGLSAAVAPFIAIALHSFIDGVVYTLAFGAGHATGLLTAFGLIVHEFSEGIILYALMRKAGVGAGAALGLAFVGAAVTTPIGALTSVRALGDDVDEQALALPLALAAGGLLYVGTIHLAAHIGARNPKRTLWALLLGAAMAMSFYLYAVH